MNYLYEDKKRYYTLNNYLQKRFNSKVFKVSLNGGFTCPNIDGTKGFGGCIYCSNGSGEYGGDKNKDLITQFNDIKSIISKKWPNSKYIAYFQANTNTYAPLNILKEKYESVLKLDNVVGISIATRCDSIEDDVLDYLEELNKRTFLIIELGLQTIHEETSNLINRGHDLKCFDKMVRELKKRHIMVVVHIINGLPYETKEMMLETIKHLNKLKIDGIKIHMLNIVKNTKIYDMYRKEKFKTLTKDEYISIVCDQIEELDKNIVIHRLTSDPNKDILIEPMWLIKKFTVLNDIDKELKKRHTYQGFNNSIDNKFYQILDSKIKKNDVVIDATIDNNNETLYLANIVENGFMFGFNIQKDTINYIDKLLKNNNINNYKLFNTSNENIDKTLNEYTRKISSIIYNFDYLPNSFEKKKTIIKNAIKLLNNKGFILIKYRDNNETNSIKDLKIDGYKILEHHNNSNKKDYYLIEIIKEKY